MYYIKPPIFENSPPAIAERQNEHYQKNKHIVDFVERGSEQQLIEAFNENGVDFYLSILDQLYFGDSNIAVNKIEWIREKYNL